MSLVQRISEKNFASTISKGLVLVDFSAEWCGPCRMLAPILDTLAKEMEGKALIVQVDVDEAQSTALQYNISSVPTLILFKDGVVKEQVIGLKDAKTLKSLLVKHL